MTSVKGIIEMMSASVDEMHSTVSTVKAAAAIHNIELDASSAEKHIDAIETMVSFLKTYEPVSHLSRSMTDTVLDVKIAEYSVYRAWYHDELVKLRQFHVRKYLMQKFDEAEPQVKAKTRCVSDAECPGQSIKISELESIVVSVARSTNHHDRSE